MFVGRIKRGVVILLLAIGGSIATTLIIPYPYSLAIIIPIYMIVFYDLFRIMPKDITCRNCHHLNPQDSSFCGKCGSILN